MSAATFLLIFHYDLGRFQRSRTVVPTLGEKYLSTSDLLLFQIHLLPFS